MNMHDATGPEPDYRPSVGPTMVSITLEEYSRLKLDQEWLMTLLNELKELVDRSHR